MKSQFELGRTQDQAGLPPSNVLNGQSPPADQIPRSHRGHHLFIGLNRLAATVDIARPGCTSRRAPPVTVRGLDQTLTRPGWRTWRSDSREATRRATDAVAVAVAAEIRTIRKPACTCPSAHWSTPWPASVRPS